MKLNVHAVLAWIVVPVVAWVTVVLIAHHMLR